LGFKHIGVTRDYDLSGSRDVIGHMTIRLVICQNFPVVHLYIKLQNTLLDILHHIAPTKLHLASQPPHVRPYSTVWYVRPTLYSQFIRRYV